MENETTETNETPKPKKTRSDAGRPRVAPTAPALLIARIDERLLMMGADHDEGSLASRDIERVRELFDLLKGAVKP